MDCLVLPVTILRRTRSRRGYRQLITHRDDDLVTVVVGKEKREFLVEPFVLEEIPFQLVLSRVKKNFNKRVIFVDHVDAILFEHMLWLMQNDSSSLFQLNLKEIIEFYAQDN